MELSHKGRRAFVPKIFRLAYTRTLPAPEDISRWDDDGGPSFEWGQWFPLKPIVEAADNEGIV